MFRRRLVTTFGAHSLAALANDKPGSWAPAAVSTTAGAMGKAASGPSRRVEVLGSPS